MEFFNKDKSQNTANDIVMNSDTAGFSKDVIQASTSVPVFVVFFTHDNTLCIKLGEFFEKLTQQANGVIRLVRINVEENPELAAQLRIRTLPTVYVFKDGQAVDGIVGEQTESDVRDFFQKFTGDIRSSIEIALDKATESLNAGNWALAKTFFAEALSEDPDNSIALAGIIRSALATGDLKEARQIVDGLKEIIALKPEIKTAISSLELAEQGNAAGDITDLRQKLSLEENNHQVRFDLAMALQNQGQSEEAIKELLTLIQKEKSWNDESARNHLVKIFDALGFSHPLAISGRRQLASILFS